jgi:hypothetical protein
VYGFLNPTSARFEPRVSYGMCSCRMCSFCSFELFFFAGTVLLNLYAKISECFVASHRTVIVGWGELGLRNKKKKVLFGFNKQ